MLKTAGNGRILEQIKLLRRDASTSPEPYTDWAVQRMTKYIPLTRGYVALVDDEDYERVSQYSWKANVRRSSVYAARGQNIDGKHRTIYLHQQIVGVSVDSGVNVDHINGDTLDCRRTNLRVCTPSQNTQNQQIRNDNRSGFKGVHKHVASGKWVAQIRTNGRVSHLGSFDNAIEAALYRDVAAMRQHKQYAWLNFPAEIIEILGGRDGG